MKRLGLCLISMFLIAGCMTPEGDSTVDGVEEAVTHQTHDKPSAQTAPVAEMDEGTGLTPSDHIRLPFVEAYIEFPGPQEKWAGPPSLLIHVVAKDPGTARVQTTPAMAPPAKSPTVVNRVMASDGLSSMSAREQLARLGDAMQGVDPVFHGCLYPVRVRLIRTDGSIFEKQGCRGGTGWPSIASEATDFFLAGGHR